MFDLVSDLVGGIPYGTWTMPLVISVVASEILVFDIWGVVEVLSSISSLASQLIEFKRGTFMTSRECLVLCRT
jgi:hypothetical protein